MVVNINDVTLTNELLEKHEVTLSSGASLKSIRNKFYDKYTLIDFSGVDPSKIDLTGLDKRLVQNIINNGLDKIDNREFFGMVFKYIEYPNEELLWNYLVDCHLISDSVYQNNTYDENLDILFKNRKKD